MKCEFTWSAVKVLITKFAETRPNSDLKQSGFSSTSHLKQDIEAVLLRVQEHQFCTAATAFGEVLYNVFSQKICIFMITKFNWLKNWSLSMHSEESSLNGLWNNKKWMLIFRTKSSPAMRLIFILMALMFRKSSSEKQILFIN